MSAAPFDIETITIHRIEGHDLNKAIKKATNRKFDPVSEGVVPGDESEGTMEVNAVPLDDPFHQTFLAEFERFLVSGKGYTPDVASGYLSRLAVQGVIPFGEYHVLYRWG